MAGNIHVNASTALQLCPSGGRLPDVHNHLAPRLPLLDRREPVRCPLERERLGVHYGFCAAGREEAVVGIGIYVAREYRGSGGAENGTRRVLTRGVPSKQPVRVPARFLRAEVIRSVFGCR